jgi:hypothetical protein
MTLTDYFARAYVVNLPERADRRRGMERELRAAGMPPTPGKVEFFPAVRPDSPGDFPGIGARGCYLSHLAILKRAIDDGLPNVLVMEDDLAVSGLLRPREGSIVGRLRSEDWGFVYLGHGVEFAPGGKNAAPLRPFSGELQMTHFYGVNAPVIGRLVAFLEAVLTRPPGHPDGGPMHLDGAFNVFRAQNPDVRVLLSDPSFGHQRSSRSDIHPSWFDRVPGLRQLAGAARAARLRLKGRKSS